MQIERFDVNSKEQRFPLVAITSLNDVFVLPSSHPHNFIFARRQFCQQHAINCNNDTQPTIASTKKGVQSDVERNIVMCVGS